MDQPIRSRIIEIIYLRGWSSFFAWPEYNSHVNVLYIKWQDRIRMIANYKKPKNKKLSECLLKFSIRKELSLNQSINIFSRTFFHFDNENKNFSKYNGITFTDWYICRKYRFIRWINSQNRLFWTESIYTNITSVAYKLIFILYRWAYAFMNV